MDFLIHERGTLIHYFHKSGEGLMRRAKRGGSWQERECVLKNALSGFGLYSGGKTTHIVTATSDRELMYLTGSCGEYRRFILTKLPENCTVLKIFIYPIRNRLNMLYSVKVGEDIALLHCILGNNETPRTVSRLKDGDFFVSANRVYYVTPDSTAGFSELANERPTLFIRTIENSSLPYIYQGHIAFESGGRIYFDSRKLCSDDGAHGIIITEYASQLFVAWQSGGFVRYIAADSSTGRPHSIINPSRTPVLYGIWHDGELCSFYGSHSDSDLVTYINPSPFDSLPEKVPELYLCRRMENMRREISELRKKLTEYR